MNKETQKAGVVDPDNRVALSDKCAKLCPENAISFPDKAETKKIC